MPTFAVALVRAGSVVGKRADRVRTSRPGETVMLGGSHRSDLIATLVGSLGTFLLEGRGHQDAGWDATEKPNNDGCRTRKP